MLGTWLLLLNCMEYRMGYSRLGLEGFYEVKRRYCFNNYLFTGIVLITLLLKLLKCLGKFSFLYDFCIYILL